MQIGFAGLLAIVFITLKLMGVIEWAWVWVLAPLWIGFVLFFVLFFILALLQPGTRLNIRKRK